MSQDEKSLTTQSKSPVVDQAMSIAHAAGIDSTEFDMSGAEVIQSGGQTKWVDLRAFMSDPNVSDKEPAQGNGKGFAGVLLSRNEMPAKQSDASAEVKTDGTKVRHYYMFRLITDCPVVYKDENKDQVEEDCGPGDIVAIGERHHLRPLKDLCDDGGIYIIAVKPHSRVKIGGGQTMWTFDIVKKTIKAPNRAKVELIAPKTPF